MGTDDRGRVASPAPTAPASVFEQVAMHAADPLLLADDGVIEWIGPSITQTLGWSPEEVVDRELAEVCQPDDRPALQALLQASAGGGVHRGVFRLRAKDGHLPWVLLTVASANGSANGSGSVVGSLREIDQRVRVRQELLEAEERYRLLVEWSSDIVLRVSLDSTIEWVTPSVTHTLGWQPVDLIGKHSMDFLHPDDAERIRREGFPMLDASGPRRTIGRWRCKDGSWRWVEGQSQVVPATADRPSFRVSRIRDVQAEVQAQQALTASEQQLRLLMQHAPVGMCVASPEGIVVEVNPALCRMLGRRAEELHGSSLHRCMHPDDVAAERQGTDQLLSGEQDEYRLMTRYLRPDASVVWGDASVSCIRNEDGSVRHVISQVLDVTERHEAEALLRAVFDSSLEPHVLLRAQRDDAGQIIDFAYADANQVACDAMGTQRPTLIGSTISHLYPEPAATQAIGMYAQILESGQSVALDAWAYPGQPEGRENRYDIRGSVVDEQTLSFAWRDVTERVRNALQIEQSEVRLRALMDSMLDPQVLVAPVRDGAGNVADFVFEDANSVACAELGAEHQALVGRMLLDALPRLTQTGLFQAASQVIDTGTPAVMDDFTCLQEQPGEERSFDIRGTSVQGSQVSLTWRDVTERHRIAERIAQSEERYRQLVESTMDVSLRVSLDGVIEWTSAASLPTLGWAPEHLIGRSFADLVHADDRTGFAAWVEHLAEAREPDTLTPRFLCGDDRYAWVSLTAQTVPATSDQRSYHAFRVRDVDQEVRAQRGLAESEARLRAVMDAAPAGIARVGIDGRFEQVNPSLCHMLGYPAEWLGRHGILDVLHPQDVPIQDAARDDLDRGQQDRLTLEERLVRSDGCTIWVQQSLAAMRDKDHRVTSYVAQFVDVTAAREANERIRESERQYRLMAENASDVVMHLRDEVIAWISPSISAALGGLPSAWLGRSLRDLIHPFDLHAYDDATTRLAAGESVVQRVRVRSDAGAYHWMEAHLSPFRIETGEIDGASASMRNVDAEVQALAELDRQARFDALTGLASRREALHRLAEARAPDRLPGGEMAVLFCDIDRFKEINDEYGHAVGDAVLRVLAQRISDAVRLGDVVARMGGDELLVLMSGVHELAEAMRVAEKLRERALEPIPTDGHQVRTSLSIGVTLSGAGESVDDLVAKADSAMYQAKRAGRNQVAAFTSSGQ